MIEKLLKEIDAQFAETAVSYVDVKLKGGKIIRITKQMWIDTYRPKIVQKTLVQNMPKEEIRGCKWRGPQRQSAYRIGGFARCPACDSHDFWRAASEDDAKRCGRKTWCITCGYHTEADGGLSERMRRFLEARRAERGLGISQTTQEKARLFDRVVDKIRKNPEYQYLLDKL